MSMVRLEHLTKTFPGNFTAVDDSSLTVANGEFLVPAVSQLWTAKIAQHADVSIGRPALLSIDLREAHFFDPRTGAAVPAVVTSDVEPAAAALSARALT